MSNELEMSAPSPTDQIDYTKHRGVRKTKSGKWGAAIRHPITKASVWLGSYNTPKEAADVFNKKQLEYQSLAVHKTKGYKNRKSFIQGPKIQDLGIKESVCLVTCNYAEDSVVSNAAVEETEDARNRNMCEANFIDQAEMNSNETKFHDNGDAVAHSSEVTDQMSADLAEAVGNTKVAIHAKRLPGSGSISRQKSGRWRAQLGYRNSNVHVGIYNTYEEAEAALDKKRQELDSVSCVEGVANEPVHRKLMCNQTPEKQESIITPCGEEDSAQVVSNTDVAIRVKRLPGSGSIYPTKGGRWQTYISSRKSKVYVGVYSTYEEAEAGIHKKRQDLDSLAQVEVEDRTTTTTRSKESMALVGCNQDPQNQISFTRPRGVFQRKSGRWFAEIKNPVTKWRGSVGTYDTAEQAFEVLNRKRREFALLKDADKKCKQMTNVAVEELQAQNSTTANCKVELIEWRPDETVLATKLQDIECGDRSARVENIQAPPCSSFDNSVINAYGQLVGEFSSLDDDLWLAESLDDNVGN